MLTDLYCDTNTILHRATPSVKILTLFVVCTLLFLFGTWWFLAGLCCLILLGYVVATIPIKAIKQSVSPVIWLLLIIFIVQLYLTGLELAAFVVLRFIAMIMLASLLTLTTRSSEIVAGIESGLRFLPNQKLAEQISLSISLCLRFIPKVRGIFSEVRAAQSARGLANDWRALTTPTIVRTLKSATEIAEAITARSPGEFSPPARKSGSNDGHQ